MGNKMTKQKQYEQVTYFILPADEFKQLIKDHIGDIDYDFYENNDYTDERESLIFHDIGSEFDDAQKWVKDLLREAEEGIIYHYQEKYLAYLVHKGILPLGNWLIKA